MRDLGACPPRAAASSVRGSAAIGGQDRNRIAFLRVINRRLIYEGADLGFMAPWGENCDHSQEQQAQGLRSLLRALLEHGGHGNRSKSQSYSTRDGGGMAETGGCRQAFETRANAVKGSGGTLTGLRSFARLMAIPQSFSTYTQTN
jgi:hypothetical protein